uniref:ATP synthase epsilon chain, chloroplastic n=1 Tax=Entransia fimbriata TaxID=130991 RepID=A0A191T4L8_9VIRI|nr:CF1 epsilon subunit of ATP synthase [Entransia fimbriata]YP_009256744.1 CF1 epsilon subunit of ATP synthase [Entransia fimbriata]ANI25343.1 CF1 epsilon subunit of ATP synthase [Entransia fimbriata]ANI25445.1 CF1 epsilon subunit of ATP synthase [Entransia fimbriata]WKT05779.1 CF1 epsilon subunit of ATP synthase [Entransia fimbriata]WKT05780.1 CF1 epsilon subunit of ATP synthase [Entransia fimbriata]WKT05898.1 CF1 epsilon subunit of ATP synthase [Entransia fimbriata]
MSMNLRVIAPNRIVWNSQAEEIILSTNSGQIGILPNHASLLTPISIGVLKIKSSKEWNNMAMMGGFAMILNNEITILTNDAEKASDIDLEEAQKGLTLARVNLEKATGRKEKIQAQLAFWRAKARLDAVGGKTGI